MADPKKRPGGSTAVMANKAPKEVERDSPQQALWRTLDYFPTPPWATRAGAEVLGRLDPACSTVREPAAGEGHMAGPLAEYFEVLPSDVHDHGRGFEVRDWLDDELWRGEPDCDWIITNPPFGIADQFVTRGLARARTGVAVLVRLAFLEGGDRHRLFADGGLTQLAIFSERVSMCLGRWQADSSLATAYAWLFWMKDAAPRPPLWIPPGSRDRLWLPDDVDRYAWKSPLPVFPEA